MLVVFGGNLIKHEMNSWAEQSETRSEIMLAFHAMEFISNGGGQLGPRENYFAWVYTTMLTQPRPWWHQLMLAR
ncbi:hypothetical protein KC865_02435 [Candidatus Kaiserbacteria bacterium]|nr:hypothetical protein [Candidatus Kaiserbacteria bacterium]